MAGRSIFDNLAYHFNSTRLDSCFTGSNLEVLHFFEGDGAQYIDFFLFINESRSTLIARLFVGGLAEQDVVHPMICTPATYMARLLVFSCDIYDQCKQDVAPHVRYNTVPT